MIRRIVGWARIPGGDWEVTMRRMKLKVGNALNEWEVQPWSTRIAKTSSGAMHYG